MSNPRSPFPTSGAAVACLLGLVVLLLALALAEFATGPQHGHRINTAALPTEAQAILAEKSHAPISAEQWRRLDAVMAEHGGWPQGEHLLVTSVRHSWYWFMALAALAAVALRVLRPGIGLSALALVSVPSVLALVFSLLASPGALSVGAG